MPLIVLKSGVADNDVHEPLVGRIRLYVDTRFRRGAAGVGKNAIFNGQIHRADYADALPVVVVRDTIADGDILAP